MPVQNSSRRRLCRESLKTPRVVGIALLAFVAFHASAAWGSFVTTAAFPAGSAPIAVAVADFNGDGILDLAVANFTAPGTVTILLGRGDGAFHSHQYFASGFFPNYVAVGDFNGDGKLDIVTTNFAQRGHYLNSGK